MSKKKFFLVFDSIFVLVWCLIMLLIALILSKHNVIAPDSGYVINPFKLIGVFGLITFYLVFLIRTSLKEMKGEKKNGNDL